ncbi:MAG: flagellar biosynthetic protein FliO [Planctomycetes bacterium]|nr:flagellar biosynthetic protein FliO [Planctomycetota bacterium]
MPNLLPTPALADAADLATRFGGSDGPDLTRYFTVCAILVVVTGLIAWGCRKLFVGTLKLRAAQRSLQTLDVLPLGGKQKLAVVRCYDRTFLVGLGSEVTPIAELDPVTTADQPRVPATKAGDAAFAQALEAVRRAMPKPLGSAPAPAPAPAPTAASEPKKKVVRRKVRKAPAAAAAAPTPSARARRRA